MPQPPDHDLPAFHVIGDQITTKTTLASTGNGLATVHVVPYVIDDGPAKGHTGTVDVPPDEFTPDGVMQALREHISNVHGIAAIGKPRA